MKAYDLKELGEKLKGAGLPVAEDAPEEVFKGFMEWLRESAALSKNPYDDMAMLICPKLEEYVLNEIDKIDGKED